MSVEITRLNNGIHVITHHMPHLETAALGIWVKAGARDERAEENGVAHFLEHMAFKGTPRRSARAIAEEIESAGGEINAATGMETTTYYARVLKQDWALALDILADIFTSPELDEEELERERDVILQEIAAAHDQPDDLVFDLAQAASFGDHPLGRSILGTQELVGAVTRQQILDWRNRNYWGRESWSRRPATSTIRPSLRRPSACSALSKRAAARSARRPASCPPPAPPKNPSTRLTS